MKIRRGFVSNSSSSSFCIMGSQFVEDDFPIVNDMEFEDLGEYLESFIDSKEGTKLQMKYGIENKNFCYVGIQVNALDESKTIAQLKIEVEKEMRELFKLDDERELVINFVIDGGYSG